jgi:hypothetical protein
MGNVLLCFGFISDWMHLAVTVRTLSVLTDKISIIVCVVA